MSREDDMDAFITDAKKAAAKFLALLIDKCPELMAETDKAYAYSDMARNIELYFDDTLETAKLADKENDNYRAYA